MVSSSSVFPGLLSCRSNELLVTPKAAVAAVAAVAAGRGAFAGARAHEQDAVGDETRARALDDAAGAAAMLIDRVITRSLLIG